MGNKQSIQSTSGQDIKIRLEEMYNDVLSPKHIEQTIQKDYCDNLRVVVSDKVLDRFSKDTLGEASKHILIGLNDDNVDKQQICARLGDYYVKKINLVGAIINTVRLAHLKLDRIQNGGLCLSDGKPTDPTKIGFKIPIEPSMPFNMNINLDPILLDKDTLEIRQKVFTRFQKAFPNADSSLLNSLAFIEIDNPKDCVRSGGKWIASKDEAERVYLVPAIKYAVDNKDWFKTLKKLETDVYERIGKLVSTLDLLIEERVEPKMINGKEERVKQYRDRLIYDKDLDSLILKTKQNIVELFVDLDSYFLILFSQKVLGKKHVQYMTDIENRLQKLEKLVD